MDSQYINKNWEQMAIETELAATSAKLSILETSQVGTTWSSTPEGSQES